MTLNCAYLWFSRPSAHLTVTHPFGDQTHLCLSLVFETMYSFNGHPSIWRPHSVVPNFGFREQALLLCATDPPQLRRPAQLYLLPQGNFLEGASGIEAHQTHAWLHDPQEQRVLQQRVEEDSAALLWHHTVHAVKGPCVAVHVMEVRHAGAGHMVVGQLSDHSLPVDVKGVVVGCRWWFKVVIYLDLWLAHIIVDFLTVKSYTNCNSRQDNVMGTEGSGQM